MLTQKQINDAYLTLLKELAKAKVFTKEINIIISIQEAEVLKDSVELLLDVLDYQNTQQKTLWKLSAILEDSERENK